MNGRLTPARLLALASGYRRTRVLATFVELGIPGLLASGARTGDEIAVVLGADGAAIVHLLEACVGLGLLVRQGERFHNAPDVQAFLVRGTPGDIGGVLTRDDRVSRSGAWCRFREQLLTWQPGASSSPSREAVPQGGEVDANHRLALLAGGALADGVDLSQVRTLLDLGGGTGAMAIALCSRFPQLRAVVLDLPEVVSAARARIEEHGLADRIEVRAGDVTSVPFPHADVALLANVLSLFSEHESRALLRRIHDALPPGGVVLISGWMPDDDLSGPELALLFSLEDIALGVRDVEHAPAVYEAWLTDAGFEPAGRVRYFDPFRLVAGRKPGALTARIVPPPPA